MNIKILIATIPILCISVIANAQNIMGYVYERDSQNKEIPIADANVVLLGTTIDTSTDQSGMFQLVKPDSSARWLVVSYVGFLNDTVRAEGINIKVVMQKTILLNEVKVTGEKPDQYISSLNPSKTEIISTSGLKNNACCNLSESFESNPTIDASYSDAVTGAKQIQMLGLAGKYAQILTDVLPTVRGLNAASGLNSIPGPWIESINLNKGTGSVSNGYESITGQIDVELKKPEQSSKLYLNLYGNDETRLEANVYSAQKISDTWYHMILAHGDMMQRRMDDNHDGFLDLPLNHSLSLMDRWKYESGKRIESMFGVKYFYDDRIGGSVNFHPDPDKLTTNHYGIGVTTNHGEAFMKTSYSFPKKEFQSVGLQVSGIYHDQNAYYGLREYTGIEKSLYMNLIFLSIINNTKNKFKTGVSYLYDDYNENFAGLGLKRNEWVPGAFLEYTYDDLKKFALVAGVRGDIHNDYGFIFTPRLHAKYDVGKNETIRASIGNGFRVANIFAENSAYLASSREFVIEEKLNPERAWNYGVNYTQKFNTGTQEGTFSLDLYRTNFINQVIADVDDDPTKILFYNLKGKSYSNSVQADLSYEWVRGFETRVAYKFYDVKQTYQGTLREVPLTPRNRALFTATYKSWNNHWEFSFTTQWIGKQRLPDTQSNPEAYRMPAESPSYFRLLGQATYIMKNFEFYLGSENITNYTQKDRIIAANDPFGPYFDTSNVWGPITGRTVYGGLRFTIK